MSNTVSEQARATIHAVGQAAEMVADLAEETERLRAELTEAREALGLAWLSGGASLADGIRAKTAMLERLYVDDALVMRVREMRKAQRAYFRTRRRDALERSRALEQEVDELVFERRQMTLLGGEP